MDAIQSLAALAHDGRLSVYRCLVRAGPKGLAAGEVAARVRIQPNTLSAQLSLLSNAGLIHSRREGRSIIYSADLEALNRLVLYLIEDCCEGRADVCGPILEALQASKC